MNLLTLPFIAELTKIRRDIHAHPELAFQEKRTADIVARELTAYGLEVHRGPAQTGVVGVLRKGSSQRAIGLRADMDALPLEEKSQLAHRSTHRGRMHACGHDGHTALLLGAARYLAENQDQIDFDGTVLLHFSACRRSRRRRRNHDCRRTIPAVSDGRGIWSAQLAGNSCR